MDEAGHYGNDKEESIEKAMERMDRIVSAEETARQREFAAAVRDLPHRPETYFIVTYGCQMNAHDSE